MQRAVTVVKWVLPLKKQSQSSWMSKSRRLSVTWITYQPTVSSSWVLVWFTALSWGGPLQKTCPGQHSEWCPQCRWVAVLTSSVHFQGPSTGISVSWLICVSDSQSLAAWRAQSVFWASCYRHKMKGTAKKKFDKYSNMCFNGNTVFKLMAADVVL